MMKARYDYDTLDGCKACLDDMINAVDGAKFAAVLRSNFPEEEAEQLVTGYVDKILMPLERMRSQIREAESLTGRTSAKQKLDYARYREGQPKLSDEMGDTFDASYIDAIRIEAERQAYLLDIKIGDIDDGERGTPAEESNKHLLTSIFNSMEHIGNLARQADAMGISGSGALYKLLMKVERAEERVSRATNQK